MTRALSDSHGFQSSFWRDAKTSTRDARAPRISTLLIALFAVTLAHAAEFSDPAPPRVAEVKETEEPKAEPFDRLTFHTAPKPLAKGAITTDWPRFLGPNDNATSPETHLLKTLPDGGPARVWEVGKGVSFACPAIAGERLVLFHRLDDKETIECLHAETGKRFWIHQYAAPYEERYGGGKGPRSSPVIDGGRVFTRGITGILHCLDLKTGAVIWQRDAAREFDAAPNFFGLGGSPLVSGDKLIVPLGGAHGLSVAAFDKATGKLAWGAESEWGASYASPIPAKIHGRDCILALMGGESRPPTGGLLCIDAANGKVLNATPWRARMAESVTASSPVVAGNRVFISETYTEGGAAVGIAPDFSANIAWRAPKFGTYWMTPVLKDGHLYGFDGMSPQTAALVCCEVASGKEMWREDIAWKDDTKRGPRNRIIGRGQLLAADGAFLCLGENGQLAWLDLSPRGCTVLARTTLFDAPETWTLPALSRGLLYVCQNERDAAGKPPRVICYDLRAP